MSNSSILKSSIAKKYWMALTGLFLCTFLIGHLLGNLQLIFIDGEEGRRAFNEYAYFMTHNPAIKILSYLTYISILFHAVDGFILTVQNKKARPVNYAVNNPGTTSSTPARYMAVLGTLILVFIATHMANFWWKVKFSQEIPLHTYKIESVYCILLIAVVKCANRSDNTIISIGLHINVVIIVMKIHILFCFKKSKIYPIMILFVIK
jgi:succinate dehydrogenase / fumarate reductase cytochrome b subunit